MNKAKYKGTKKGAPGGIRTDNLHITPHCNISDTLSALGIYAHERYDIALNIAFKDATVALNNYCSV